MVATSGFGGLVALALLSMGLPSRSDEWAAQIALLALRTSARDAVPRRELPISINGNPAISDAEAARVLAAIPKPVQCTAVASAATLNITCATITDPILLEAQGDKARVVERLRSSYGTARREPTLLLEAFGERTVVPLRAIEIFLRDYRLNYALAFDDPDDEAQGLGATGIVWVRSVGDVEMTGTFPNLRWVFGKQKHPET